MKITENHKSRDGISFKFLQKATDGHIIETGLFDLPQEETPCISTQVGCPLGCIFCSSTLPVDAINPNIRFVRNLTDTEICSQVENVLNASPLKGNKPVLLSYMGIGEPFLNYENLVSSIKKLHQNNDRIKRVTIATSGVSPENIKKLANEKFPGLIVKIQLSLHASNPSLRKRMMPNAGSMKKAIEATYYFAKTTKQRIKLNYILISGLNDSQREACELAELLREKKDWLTVKLMRYNENPEIDLKMSKNFKIFEQVLLGHKIKTSRYASDGRDIKSNCGQLRRYYYG